MRNATQLSMKMKNFPLNLIKLIFKQVDKINLKQKISEKEKCHTKNHFFKDF
jgi:predicted lipid carrier protein YhbT